MIIDGKVVPQLNYEPSHEDVCGNGGIALRTMEVSGFHPDLFDP
jgi:hypothetical protein